MSSYLNTESMRPERIVIPSEAWNLLLLMRSNNGFLAQKPALGMTIG